MVDDLEWKTVEPVVKASIVPPATVRTDGYPAYRKLKAVVNAHQGIPIPAKEASPESIRDWVHTVISNTKRTFGGIPKAFGIGREYLQNYLPRQMAWKMNRRYFGEKLFDRLMVAAISDVWYSTNKEWGIPDSH